MRRFVHKKYREVIWLPTTRALAPREPRPDIYARVNYTSRNHSISVEISQISVKGIPVTANDAPETPARRTRVG